MKYSAVAVLAAVAGASAHYGKNETVITETVSSYVTYCPAATEITHGTHTYTVTEPTTLTITDCPCTITRPIITTSEVVCHDCPIYTSAPGYTNSTGIVTIPTTAPSSTGAIVTSSSDVPPSVPTVPSSAGKAAALSGAGLAGLLGLAAFVL